MVNFFFSHRMRSVFDPAGGQIMLPLVGNNGGVLMLKVIFFGCELEILDVLTNHADVVGVFFKAPQRRLWHIRSHLFSHRSIRTFVRSQLDNSRMPKKKRWLKHIKSYTIYDYCIDHHLNLLQACSIHDQVLWRHAGELNADLGIVANFSEKIPPTLLAATEKGFVNFHPSLLPKYRGADPFSHVLLNGDTESGVTWHRMTSQFDKGNILAQDRFTISGRDGIKDLIAKSIGLGSRMLPALLQSIEAGTVLEYPQDDAQATYCPKLSNSEKRRLRTILHQRTVK